MDESAWLKHVIEGLDERVKRIEDKLDSLLETKIHVKSASNFMSLVIAAIVSGIVSFIIGNPS